MNRPVKRCGLNKVKTHSEKKEEEEETGEEDKDPTALWAYNTCVFVQESMHAIYVKQRHDGFWGGTAVGR